MFYELVSGLYDLRAFRKWEFTNICEKFNEIFFVLCKENILILFIDLFKAYFSIK